MDPERIELSYSACKAEVLPLNDGPEMLAAVLATFALISGTVKHGPAKQLVGDNVSHTLLRR